MSLVRVSVSSVYAAETTRRSNVVIYDIHINKPPTEWRCEVDVYRMPNDVAQVVMAIGTVFEVLVCVLVVVLVVVVAVVVLVVVVVAAVPVAEDTTDSVRSLFPEVLWLSRYDIVAVHPGTVGLSRLRERYRLEECDLYRDLATSLPMHRRVSVCVYILYPLVADPAVWDPQSRVS